MSDMCFPDSLLGNLPNIYYYAANNPSEATIAKRRSYANTISCACLPDAFNPASRSHLCCIYDYHHEVQLQKQEAPQGFCADMEKSYRQTMSMEVLVF